MPSVYNTPMDIGLIGSGKMGRGLLKRWVTAGHTVTVFDPATTAQAAVHSLGGQPAASVEQLVHSLPAPRRIWLMIPAQAVADVLDMLSQELDSGDVVFDGGNSHYIDSRRRAATLAKRGIHFIDVGVSGGVQGEQAGYALMVGGEAAPVDAAHDIFAPLQAPDAFAYVGEAGAGHFVKMVHNAIEYGTMQAIGEGFDLLKNGPYAELDMARIATLWSHGTIVRSFLMELAASALSKDGSLSNVAPYVEDSGEGRWSVAAAVEHAVPFWVNTAALYARFDSRQADLFAAKLIAALRQEFGGHAVKPAPRQ